MIGFLVTNRHRYTIDTFVDEWAPELQDSVRVLAYEHLLDDVQLPVGSYVFSDLERLSGRKLDAARRLYDGARRDERIRTYNDPWTSLTRYPLLRTLREKGINDFNVYRLTDTRQPERFPVFLREEHQHNGSLTPLLRDQAELDRAISQLYVRRRGLADLLMIEFCDTSDDRGMFRKYAAFLVGDEVIPKHLFFNTGWLVKHAHVVTDELVRQEMDYIHTNPHADELRKMFSAAGISFGRVDYGMVDGRVQVWEINTNPVLMTPRSHGDPARQARKVELRSSLAAAFVAMDVPELPGLDLQTVAPGPRVNVIKTWQGLKRRIGSHKGLRRVYTAARPDRSFFFKPLERFVGLVWKPIFNRLQKKQWR